VDSPLKCHVSDWTAGRIPRTDPCPWWMTPKWRAITSSFLQIQITEFLDSDCGFIFRLSLEIQMDFRWPDLSTRTGWMFCLNTDLLDLYTLEIIIKHAFLLVQDTVTRLRAGRMGFYSRQGYFLIATIYEGTSKSLWTDSITKYKLTFGITRWESTQRVTAAKLTILAHKIAIQLHLLAESCTSCSARSRRPVRKLFDTPLYTGSEAYPASYPMDIGGSFPADKAAGAWRADHSPLSSA
jgi:hypothetical protein